LKMSKGVLLLIFAILSLVAYIYSLYDKSNSVKGSSQVLFLAGFVMMLALSILCFARGI
jgi:hypothetical protein